MTAADIRPDYDPSAPNGALWGVVAAVFVTLGAVVAGAITLAVIIMNGTR